MMCASSSTPWSPVSTSPGIHDPARSGATAGAASSAVPAGASLAAGPYVAASVTLPELTLRALLLGVVLGMIFGVSSLYLVLKVGLTVSASIPVAVIAATLFRLAHRLGARDASILECNIAQTAGSAGESIAFGLGVTMPAILILGFDLEIWRVMLVGVLGGALGILMMIPLRRTLIVEQHQQLKYPEGTACAEVLKGAADPASRQGGLILSGLAGGLAYKVLNVALKGWKDTPEMVFGSPLAKGSIAAEISPELLGVGYIIGLPIAATMAAGGVLSYLLLIPLIQYFGSGLDQPLAPATQLVRAMSPQDIRSAYILYIGAGAVATGGLISLLRALPSIVSSLRASVGSLRAGTARVTTQLRTEDDIPLPWVLLGVFAILGAITLATPLNMNLLGALLILVFGFLFATVSSRLTGEIGSSSNPISGMTVATLLLTCLIFLLMGWTGGQHYVTALSVGAIVCIAASNAGSTSQDLKTGFLLGATPRLQQFAILAGALASALVLGPVLLTLNDSATVYVPVAEVAPGLVTRAPDGPATEHLQGPQARQDGAAYHAWHKTDARGGPAGKYLVDNAGRAVWLVDPGINGGHTQRPDGSTVHKYDAPKAVLMSYIIKGILDRQLPWPLVLFGVMIALVLELCGVASLAFAVGVYLPLASSAPLLVGGLVRWVADRRNVLQAGERNLDADARQLRGDGGPGVLLASGYIAGGALAGIIIAFGAGVFGDLDQALADWASAHNPAFAGSFSDGLSLLPYLLLVVALYRGACDQAETRSRR